jgi:hypothetical protein
LEKVKDAAVRQSSALVNASARRRARVSGCWVREKDAEVRQRRGLEGLDQRQYRRLHRVWRLIGIGENGYSGKAKVEEVQQETK